MFQGHTEIAKKLINAGCKINELIYVINSKMFNDAKIFILYLGMFRWGLAAAPFT